MTFNMYPVDGSEEKESELEKINKHVEREKKRERATINQGNHFEEKEGREKEKKIQTCREVNWTKESKKQEKKRKATMKKQAKNYLHTHALNITIVISL